MKKDKLLILLTFMYIFAFRIYSVIDSAVIVGFILTVFIIVNKEYRNYIIKTIKNRNVFRLVICMIVLTIWSIIVLIINQKTHELQVYFKAKPSFFAFNRTCFSCFCNHIFLVRSYNRCIYYPTAKSHKWSHF